MHLQLRLLASSPIAVLTYLTCTGVASAGTITAQGNVTALTKVKQLRASSGPRPTTRPTPAACRSTSTPRKG